MSAAPAASPVAPQSKIVPFPSDEGAFANRNCLHHVKPLPLRGAPKAVLLVLALHASLSDWTCKLSFPTLAMEAGCCERQAKRAVERLELGGYIRIVMHGKGRSANTYQVLRQADPAPKTASAVEPEKPRSRDISTASSDIPPRSRDIPSAAIEESRRSEDSLRPRGAPAAKTNEYRAVFEAVAMHIFHTDPEQLTVDGGRIGLIASWLCRRIDHAGKKPLGHISRPATADHIVAFARRWQSTYPKASLPLDLVKFVEHWRAFASASTPTARGWMPVVAEPVANIPLMTPQERATAVAAGRSVLRASMAAAERAGQ